MTTCLPAIGGTIVLVRIVRAKEWRRYQVVAWEPLTLEDGPQILCPVVVTGPYASPWTQELYPVGETIRVTILSETDDRCLCPNPDSMPHEPLACTNCGRHLRERWTESPPR